MAEDMEVLTRFDDLSGDDGDMQSPVVEVLDRKLASSQRRQEVDLGLTVQVIPLPLELLVGLLLHYNDDISGDDPRRLVALPRKLDLLTTPHPLVDVDLEHLSLADSLLAVASLAPILGVHHLARPLALVAWLLDLLHHRAELAEHDLDALPATRRAGGDRALLAATALAALANDGFRQGELLNLALVEVLEGDADAVDEVLSASRSRRAGTCAASATNVNATTAHSPPPKKPPPPPNS
jgi:hypothetical protein